MKASSVSSLLFKQLGYTAVKEKIVSTNISNKDTPGYKTKEISFNEQLNSTRKDSSRINYDMNLKLSYTNSAHMKLDDTIKTDKKDYTIVMSKNLDEQNDGNNVDLDTQMSEMAQNSVIFSAIQSSIRKDSAWFKSVIDASSKN